MVRSVLIKRGVSLHISWVYINVIKRYYHFRNSFKSMVLYSVFNLRD